MTLAIQVHSGSSMFQLIHHKTAATRLLAKAQAMAKSSQVQQKSGSYFSNVIDSVSAAKSTATNRATPAAKSVAGIDKISSRQNTGSVARQDIAGVTRQNAAGGKVSTVTAKASDISTPQTPVDVLNAALEAAGLIPSQFKVESHEEWVVYPGPGGGYMHRYTNVQLPNGRQENFSTDLMAQYPDITVNEIKRILRIGNGDPNSGMF